MAILNYYHFFKKLQLFSKILLHSSTQSLKNSRGELLWSWPIRSGAADLGPQWGFLRQGNTRTAEIPARSWQLWGEMLRRPGCCQSNSSNPHKNSLRSASDQELCDQSRQTGRGVAVYMEGHAGKASSPYQLKRSV